MKGPLLSNMVSIEGSSKGKGKGFSNRAYTIGKVGT